MNGSPKFRIVAVLLTLIVGGLFAGLLTMTATSTTTADPGLHVPGAPNNLGSYKEFTSNVTEPLSAFYDIPPNLGNDTPGTILKWEPIKGAPAGTVAYRIMYRSTNVDGTPAAITGAFFDQATPGPANGRPLVGFAHGTVGMGRYCGISQAPFQPGLQGVLFWDSQIQPLVAAGYAVVATDFEDMGAAGTPSYLVAQSEAYAVLDSMRAAGTQFQDRIDPNNEVLFGHSQGGQGSLAAAAYWQDYAPDLAIRGAVSEAPGIIIGLPIVAKQLVASTTGSSASSRGEFLAYLTKSWTATFPNQLQASDVLTPEGLAMLPLTGKLCGSAFSEKFNKPLAAYVKEDIPPQLVKLLNENVPVEPIPMPILFTQGLADTTIVPQFTMAAYKTMCQYGSNVALREYEDTTHTQLLIEARADAIDWLNARVTGEPAQSTCAEAK